MKYNQITRRHFLQGIGGSLMALPILPSLLSREALAQSLQSPTKFLVLMNGSHGGTGENSDWYPSPVLNNLSSPLLTQTEIFSLGGENSTNHIVHHAFLRNLLSSHPGHEAGDVDRGQQRLSYILGSFLNPHLDKINFFRGIDGGMSYYGHSGGISWGNIWDRDENPLLRWPKMTDFLANSPNFYKNKNVISVPSVELSPFNLASVDKIYAALFDKYSATASPTELAKKERTKLLIDRVHEDYNRLLKGSFGLSRQISSEDKLKLEQHVALLDDVQNKYLNFINSCSDVLNPKVRLNFRTDTTAQSVLNAEKAWDISTDLLVSAFQCGATQLATLSGGIGGNYPGSYHQEVAHNGGNRDKEVVHNTNFRWMAQHMLGNVVKKLSERNAADGQSLMDHSLVVWTHECGYKTHQLNSLGLVTVGSLGGYFKTGLYIDYRDHNNFGFMRNPEDYRRPGIPIQRLWANIMQGMGIQRAEFERGGRPGYGDTTKNSYTKPSTAQKFHYAFPKRIINSLSDKMPIIT